MAVRRIERWFDGSLRSTFGSEPRLTSASTPWSGYLMERDPCHAGCAINLVYPHTEVVLVKSGRISFQDRPFADVHRFTGGPGSVNIWPAGYESRSISWTPDQSTEIISVQVDPSVLAHVGMHIGSRPISMQAAVEDPELVAIIQLMEAEVQGGASTGRLYGESLCLALASRLLGRYGNAPAANRRSRSCSLPDHARERVRDHILANLSGDLSLAELGAVAGFSPQHLTVAFRNSFGTTPHQYVLKQRIDRAKRLLATSRMPIADMAYDLGFSTQSHFTAAFRRAVGLTPQRYRTAR